MGVMSEGQSNASRIREINDSIRYTMWSVFRLATPLGDDDRAAEGAEVEKLFAALAEEDVVVRGVYDVSGLRADADLMVWWHAADSEPLQSAYHRFRRTAFGRRLEPVWSQMALHRPAEFNRSHVPAFLADEDAKRHVCVYPFVRSYEWYLLPEEERRELLKEHGQMARDYKDVRANTVSSLRARRLRVAARLRGRRPVAHRRPDAAPARVRRAAPRARGGAVLHRRARARRRPRRPAALDLVGTVPALATSERDAHARDPARCPGPPRRGRVRLR